MITPQPDYQRFTDHWSEEDAATDTFTVQMPRWRFLRLFGRSPLVRTIDRVEGLILVMAVVLSLLAAPIAAAAGTAVYDSRRHIYADQAQTSRTVAATVIDDGMSQISPSKSLRAHARWFVDGAEHTGTIQTRQAVKPGESVDIWVDQHGNQVGPPTKSAAAEAAAAALAIWLSAAMAVMVLLDAIRAFINRVRHAAWQRDFDDLLGHGDGDRRTSQF
ncbi:MAG TPA: hypothetical protein VFA16_07540 [Mycobacterium sp.]|uniref:Rv1733c family protein n=1 Tax=Mycobacterium sp. TaxID=1785 RepID=UPI002D37CFCC|nr:hypothetical protein [Mycobacterium sp.]HZU47088.1 hypothetical protein [Mycobacterium sp.]